MEHQGSIYHYMQKIRFFAVFLLAISLTQLFSTTATTKTASARTFPTLTLEERTLTLPAARDDLSSVSQVIPGGDAVAVRLTSQGVIILGFTDEDKSNPARAAGLRRGDRIVAIGAVEIDGNQAMTYALQKNQGATVSLRYCRGNKESETTATPRKNQDGTWQLGVLVKDSTAGIGTLTYVVPDSGEYGCLGHGISDPDTDTLFCVGNGNLYPAQITNLRKGQAGTPGELQGMFGASPFGICTKNRETGLFGQLDPKAFEGRETVPVALKNEVREGDAVIRCTLDEGGIKEYSIEIVRIYRTFGGATKNMLLRVTDPQLLEQTGGIVQGMSGSPVLQNGKLVGAVTHVLINDPSCGYGIFIENMLNSAA